MILRLKICFTIFALYEIAAITLLYCQRTCDAMFSTAFCDTGFKYFALCVAAPVLVYLIGMWIREIFVGRRRHSFARKARHAVKDLVDNVRSRVSENVSTQDLEKIIAATILVAVKRYADRHPRVRETFDSVMDAATGEYDDAYDDADYDDDASSFPARRVKPKSNIGTKKRK